MSVPFKSLRFNPHAEQPWGIYLGRWVPRTGEWSFWPRISNRQQSLLSQMARLEGLDGITGGRGTQLIPYVAARAFKTLDRRAPGGPAFVEDRMDGRLGLDAKLVLRDVVLDLTANPDFSQVESDSPQITTNQRFEVFFPEKRPFFLENAGLFSTPINLLFTRRLADPRLGARLTGKAGGWTFAGLASDDNAPGSLAAPGDPGFGLSTWAGIARVSRRLTGQTSVGAIATTRHFSDRTNTVGGFDASIRLGRVWSGEGQWVASRSTGGSGGTAGTGSAYMVDLSRTGRTVSASTRLAGVSPDFTTDLGFVPRIDHHHALQRVTYSARPATTLNDWGPTLLLERYWRHDGAPLDWRARPSLSFNFTRSTTLGAFIERAAITLDREGGERLVLEPHTWGLNASTSPKPTWSFSGSMVLGRAVNFSPAPGRLPDVGDHRETRVTVGLRPARQVRIDNTWLRTRLALARELAFRTDIVRTRWAWQFTKEWSLRVITQYDSTRTDPSLTAIAPRRNLNADVLLTRLLNPWTALYVGYNTNAQNIELVERAEGPRAIRRTGTLAPDGWQVFAKWSHLLRW